MPRLLELLWNLILRTIGLDKWATEYKVEEWRGRIRAAMRALRGLY